jgi:VanZ family protein
MSKFKYWLPAVLYMALIFWLSSRPAPEFLKELPIIYKLKIVHIIEYAIMFLFAQNALFHTSKYSKIEICVLSLAIIVLFGLTDEFHQIFIQGRTARFEDVLADGVGGLMSWAGLRFKQTNG